MGASRDNQARDAVSLIRSRSQGPWDRSLTNVLNPLTLPASEVVRLSARRWESALAFRLRKDYLTLNRLWSAKWQVSGAPIGACLTLAQLFHAWHMKAAAQGGGDP